MSNPSETVSDLRRLLAEARRDADREAADREAWRACYWKCNESYQKAVAALASAEEENARLREALKRIMRCTDDFSAEDVARAALDPKGSDK